ncbi:F-box/kelch-repeat protein [Abeliophyllum distichum]|uniref:F-box/kelch-repeat protein n=1 Tax=Abeliophyllum distichum TaxID=126358 RepID=A0ABD1RAR7_9LAMI
MSSDNTSNSRHFSWLMKSCFPNHQHHHQPTAISVAATTISALPDDLILECLSRVNQSSLTSIPFVCRRWAHLINSTSFYHLRHHYNLLFNTIFSIYISRSALFAASLRLNHQFEPTWKVSTFIPSSSSLHLPNDCILENGSVFPFYPHYRLVSIGRKIYIIGRTAMLRCDTWTGTLVPKARMGFPRKKFAAAEVAGKIYVAGGSSRPEAVEEYDPDENKWRVVSHAPRRRYGCIGAAVDGVFYVIGGLKIGAAGNEAAHVYASSMDLYDVEARGWLRSRALPGGGCVVAACAANGHLYILSSHAVELSFWKFNGSRKSGEFGEWRRIKPPPLPAQVRLDSTVGFSCVGVGDKVVLIQVVGCIDDLLRRSGRKERGLKEGLVLVYDCTTEEWSRAADSPEVIRRAACVCVEC